VQSRLLTVTMKIRQMKEDEINTVSELLCACYRWLADREGYTPEQLEFLVHKRGSPETVRHESRKQLYLVACIGGAILGMASVSGNEVTKLYVEPGSHGQGIGAGLLAAAETAIRRAGFDRMFLGTMSGAVPFYEAMGMTVSGTKRPSSGPFGDREVVLMAKSLTGPSRV
jgi:GNAT superfamily N-acetyltransferase